MFQPDDPGKFSHPNLTSQDIVDLADLTVASYLDFYDNSVSGWSAITHDLVNPTFGLSADLVPVGTTTFRSLSPWFPDFLTADAEATVYLNSDNTVLTVAIRGTEWEAGSSFDAEDWIEIAEHADLFDPLMDAVKLYADLFNIDNIWFTGHSLGAGAAEIILSENVDNNFSSISYNSVTFASPLAGHDDDDARNLNIGHEGDWVFSLNGIRGANSISDLLVVMDDNDYWLTNPIRSAIDNISEGFANQHSSLLYTYTTRLLLESQFYEHTDRDSKVAINYTNDVDALDGIMNEWFSDSPALVLGRDEDIANPYGGTLSVDDHLIGGGGDDYLEGFSGDDTLEGDRGEFFSGGNDTMAGGEGQDLFLGTPDDLDGDSIVDFTFGDRIQLEGVSRAAIEDDWSFDVSGDTLTLTWDEGFLSFEQSININTPGLGDKTLVLVDDEEDATFEIGAGGHDIAFVVDTTGSMSDDIASVKAQATSIINSIFDPARGLENSRIAVVGYNDPSTRTFLEFTDHEETDDRKSAALSAINSLSASGGGDFPEMVYSGLLRALDGRAGEWSEDALARRIFVFGDAPAKDTHLLDDVLRLARDLDVSVSAETRSEALSDEVTKTTLSVTSKGAEGDTLSVEIFTIVIGTDPTTRDEFAALAEETGGEALSSADATEIADVLFDAIQTGTDGDDVIIGNDRANDLNGGTGDDDISGRDGDDEILGGSGDDTLKGEDGDDDLMDGLGNNSIEGGDGLDELVVLSGLNELFGGGDSDLLVGGIQADKLDAGTGDDVVIGDAGNGFFGGSDIITGGTGDDTMMGGTGADTFVFNTNDGNDVIGEFAYSDVASDPVTGFSVTPVGADFDVGVDLIQLAGFATTDASNVMSAVSDTADGAVFNAEGTSILFFGVSADQLSADDFLFV